MSHSYCINDEGPAPLASAHGALWGRAAHALHPPAPPPPYPLPGSIWPLDAYLLSVTYVCVRAGAQTALEREGGQRTLALYVFSAPSGGQHRPGLGTSAPPIHPRVLSN